MNDVNNDNKNSKASFDAELARLERRVEELLVTVEALKEENRALRQRQESLAAERSAFAQRNDQVRARVEAMIGRLKTMEHTA
jgi:cell division protein ZapB